MVSQGGFRPPIPHAHFQILYNKNFYIDSAVKECGKSLEENEQVHVKKKEDNLEDCKHGPPHDEQEQKAITVEDDRPDPKY